MSERQLEIVSRFSNLFQGRTDFLGTDEGGCVRLYEPFAVTEAHYKEHLLGTREPIGIYPVVEQYSKDDPRTMSVVRKQFVVRFGAVDIDVEDLALAKNVWTACHALGLSAWLERSRSKGYHVWIFASDWVPASLVRSALQAACDVVGYQPKEIYPKQTELADGSPGNYIRLPYPGALLQADPPTNRVVLDVSESPARELGLEIWVSLAWDSRCFRSDLEEAAALAAPPKPKHRPAVLRPGSSTYRDLAPLVGKMGGLAHTIWRDGPLEGSDRSTTLLRLAYHLRDDGFTADEAFLLVEDADERWGKFFDRADKDDRLWELLDKAYDEC